jgi:hypothetical protein
LMKTASKLDDANTTVGCPDNLIATSIKHIYLSHRQASRLP